MIKILSVEQIRQADLITIEREPIASVDLMERAAHQCFKWIKKRKPKGRKFKVFCGTGNNGGDGLVIARLLAQHGYHCEVFSVRFSEKYSEDCAINLNRLFDLKEVPVTYINGNEDFPDIQPDDIIIDAIFGSGLSKPVAGFTAELIRHINASGALVIAIDIPSGLFADFLPDNQGGAIIRAKYTLTFQFPKLSFLFAESEQFAGAWQVLPIGLHEGFIQHSEVSHYLIETEDVVGLQRPRQNFSHKGNFGHALLIAGSYGKMGAAVLAAQACMRSGAGLLTAHIPLKGYEIIQTAFPEAMISLDEEAEFFSNVPVISAYNAIAIGPGLGTETQTQNGLKLMIQECKFPMILDADALNILSENKTWLSFLPPGSILTPHPKEFERLAGKTSNSLERLDLQLEFSKRYNVYVILKGAFTSITIPNGDCYFNPTGNPGMATGGSGDVLTGILLGLMAQGYDPLAASLTGVFVHGLAGDIAAHKQGYEALIASDIIRNLGRAFRMVRI